MDLLASTVNNKHGINTPPVYYSVIVDAPFNKNTVVTLFAFSSIRDSPSDPSCQHDGLNNWTELSIVYRSFLLLLALALIDASCLVFNLDFIVSLYQYNIIPP